MSPKKLGGRHGKIDANQKRMMQARVEELNRLARRFSQRRGGEPLDDLYRPRPRDR
jgi:hypothetical protein